MSKNSKLCATIIGCIASTLIFILILNNSFNNGYIIAVFDIFLVIILLDFLLDRVEASSKAKCNAIALKYSISCKLAVVIGLVIEHHFGGLNSIGVKEAKLYYYGFIIILILTLTTSTYLFFRNMESNIFKAAIAIEFFTSYIVVALYVKSFWTIIMAIPFLSVYDLE